MAAGSSVTVETAPLEGVTEVEPSTATATTPIKTEDTPSKKSTTQAKLATPKKPKVKKEVDDTQELPEDFMDELGLDDRVDLAELDLPGGPVSSQRKNERMGRWKRVELWIEQEEAEEIILDDDEDDASRQQVRVKIEDEPMEDVTVPAVETIPTPQVTTVESDEDVEEKMKIAAKNRKRRKRRALKGKTQEEKEEMAREEVDLEVLGNNFLAADASEVFSYFKQLLTTVERTETVSLAVTSDSTAPTRCCGNRSQDRSQDRDSIWTNPLSLWKGWSTARSCIR